MARMQSSSSAEMSVSASGATDARMADLESKSLSVLKGSDLDVHVENEDLCAGQTAKDSCVRMSECGGTAVDDSAEPSRPNQKTRVSEGHDMEENLPLAEVKRMKASCSAQKHF